MVSKVLVILYISIRGRCAFWLLYSETEFNSAIYEGFCLSGHCGSLTNGPTVDLKLKRNFRAMASVNQASVNLKGSLSHCTRVLAYEAVLGGFRS